MSNDEDRSLLGRIEKIESHKRGTEFADEEFNEKISSTCLDGLFLVDAVVNGHLAKRIFKTGFDYKVIDVERNPGDLKFTPSWVIVEDVYDSEMQLKFTMSMYQSGAAATKIDWMNNIGFIDASLSVEEHEKMASEKLLQLDGKAIAEFYKDGMENYMFQLTINLVLWDKEHQKIKSNGLFRKSTIETIPGKWIAVNEKSITSYNDLLEAVVERRYLAA